MKKPTELLFGTAGIPLSADKRDTINGIPYIRKLGLDAMELEFVRSINISKEKAPLVRQNAEKSNITLTCHAPYFINLNSLEKAKLEASKKRIIDSARIANMCGAWSTTFHAAFYQAIPKEKVYENVKKEIKEIVNNVKKEGINIWIRPETTGKGSQFGDIDELCRLSKELENVMPCIDFAHLHARSGGKINTYKEFCEILQKVEKYLGKEGLENMHIHMSGIAYSDKGEQHHLELKESDYNYKDLMKALKHFKVKGVVISESPNIEKDALLMQKTYKGL